MSDPESQGQTELAPSAMAERFNFIFRFFAKRFFRHFALDEAVVARLRRSKRAAASST